MFASLYFYHQDKDDSRVKRSTGIPSSFLTMTDRHAPGALLTASGKFAVPTIDQ